MSDEELRAIKDRHRVACPDHATQQYAEQAHADVLFVLNRLMEARKMGEWLAGRLRATPNKNGWHHSSESWLTAAREAVRGE